MRLSELEQSTLRRRCVIQEQLLLQLHRFDVRWSDDTACPSETNMVFGAVCPLTCPSGAQVLRARVGSGRVIHLGHRQAQISGIVKMVQV